MKFIWCALVLLLSTRVTNGQTYSSGNKVLDNLLEDALRGAPDSSELSIAVLNRKDLNYYGVLLKDSLLMNVANSARLFEIGSVTKVFTSALLAQMVVDGNLSLEQSINPYFNFPFNKDVQLGFRQLSNHSAGLPKLPDNLKISFLNAADPYAFYGTDELVSYLKNVMKVDSSIIGRLNYSNTGVGLLGYTLGLVQKNGYAAALKAKVLLAYGMRNTYVGYQGVPIQELVAGRKPNGDIAQPWHFDALVACGGMISSVTDLVKFMKAQLDPANKAGQLMQQSTLRVNDNLEFGLGWFMPKTKSGDKLVLHDGQTGGYTSFMVLNITQGKGVVILSNLSGLSPNNSTRLSKLAIGLLNGSATF